MTSILGQLPGGSRSLLVECDQGKRYVLKRLSNPQGPNVAANELIAFRLMRELGIPTPNAFRADLVPDCIPGLRASLAGCALEVVRAPAGGILHSIPPADWTSRIRNRDDLLGAFVFDAWAATRDGRQAMFLSSPDSLELTAVFIDNGHLFGGPRWKIAGCERHSYARDLYRNALWFDSESIGRWVSAVRSVASCELTQTLDSLPPSWCVGNRDRLETQLRERLDRLEEIVVIRLWKLRSTSESLRHYSIDTC